MWRFRLGSLARRILRRAGRVGGSFFSCMPQGIGRLALLVAGVITYALACPGSLKAGEHSPKAQDPTLTFHCSPRWCTAPLPEKDMTWILDRTVTKAPAPCRREDDWCEGHSRLLPALPATLLVGGTITTLGWNGRALSPRELVGRE